MRKLVFVLLAVALLSLSGVVIGSVATSVADGPAISADAGLGVIPLVAANPIEEEESAPGYPDNT